jgi:hypothetical protein
MDALKVMLAVHVYGDVCGETVKSLVAELRADAPDLRWDLAFPASDALVSRLRSEVVTRAIQGGHDVLVWLDHDIEWEPGMLAGLVRRCSEVKGVVGALTPFRAEWMFGRGFPWRPLPGTPAEVDPGVDRLVEADKVGGSFVAFWVPALRRTVEALERSEDPVLRVTRCRSAVQGWFWDVCRPVAVPYEDGEAHHHYLSEDWALVMRLQACGFKAYLWTLPFIRHIGRKAFGAGDALGIPGPVDAVEDHLRMMASPDGPFARRRSTGDPR